MRCSVRCQGLVFGRQQEVMLTLLLVHAVLLCDEVGGLHSRRGSVRLRVYRGHMLGGVCVDLALEGLQVPHAVVGGCIDGVDLCREETAGCLEGIAREGAAGWVSIQSMPSGSYCAIRHTVADGDTPYYHGCVGGGLAGGAARQLFSQHPEAWVLGYGVRRGVGRAPALGEHIATRQYSQTSTSPRRARCRAHQSP